MSALPCEAAFRAACERQAESCLALGSALTAKILRLFAINLQAGDGAVAARLLGWSGDPSGAGDSVPLRLAGGLRLPRPIPRSRAPMPRVISIGRCLPAS